jgi:hypothetical protein
MHVRRQRGCSFSACCKVRCFTARGASDEGHDTPSEPIHLPSRKGKE